MSPHNATKLCKHAPPRPVTAQGHQMDPMMTKPQFLFSDRTDRTSTDLEPDFDHVVGSDDGSWSSGQPDFLGASGSIDSHDNTSQTTKPTEPTPGDQGDYDVDGAPLPAQVPCCINQGQYQDQGKPLLQAENCNTQGTTQTGTYKVPLIHELWPGCYDHEIGSECIAQGSYTEEAGGVQFIKGSPSLNATWTHPDERTCEVQKAIQWADSVTSRDTPAVNEHSACGLLPPVPSNSMSATYLCATEDGSSPCVLNAARETQVHEHENKIHRLMPPDRIIGFSVNRKSFQRCHIPDDVTDQIIRAAQEIESVIKRANLGIKFAYRPNYASNVFDIYYNPRLGPRTLAQAFFPSDLRTSWALGISNLLACPRPGSNYLPCLRNILAHEFAHILGLRHWNADAGEREPSFQWPNTEKGSRRSVMNTTKDGSPLSEIWFSGEDFRVIKEIYSLGNGQVFERRNVVDVHPRNGSRVSSRSVRRCLSL